MSKMKRESLLDSAVSEIEYSIKTKHTKSEEVHEHYLRNAIRFIEEAKEVNKRGGGMTENVLNTEQKIVLSYLKGLRKIYEWETIFGLIRRFHVNYSDSYMGGNVQEAYFKLCEDERTVVLIAFCEWDMAKEVAE